MNYKGSPYSLFNKIISFIPLFVQFIIYLYLLIHSYKNYGNLDKELMIFVLVTLFYLIFITVYYLIQYITENSEKIIERCCDNIIDIYNNSSDCFLFNKYDNLCNLTEENDIYYKELFNNGLLTDNVIYLFSFFPNMFMIFYFTHYIHIDHYDKQILLIRSILSIINAIIMIITFINVKSYGFYIFKKEYYIINLVVSIIGLLIIPLEYYYDKLLPKLSNIKCQILIFLLIYMSFFIFTYFGNKYNNIIESYDICCNNNSVLNKEIDLNVYLICINIV